ncbi:MAG TPA: hypothetical protein VE960_03405 [bacterium]|nr:hypothetical protein [bacterium]
MEVVEMKQLMIVSLALMVAVTAFAGDNPQVYGYISFDAAGDPAVNVTQPAPYSTVDAYFALGCVEGGMTTVSFGLNNAMAECPGVMATQAFVNLMPGNLMIGDPFDGVGATIASTECMLMDPVIVGYGTYFYLGGDCVIELLDHADYPRWVVDCQDPGQVDYYCLAGAGAVGAAVAPAGEDCPCGSPVEDATWGGIKALYR